MNPEAEIVDYLLDELSDAERTAFEQRMESDPALRARTREWESILCKTMSPGPESGPVRDDLWERIELRLPDKEPETKPVPILFRPWLIPTGIAAMLALALIGAWNLWRSDADLISTGRLAGTTDRPESVRFLAERLYQQGYIDSENELYSVNPDDLIERIRLSATEESTLPGGSVLLAEDGEVWREHYRTLAEENLMLMEEFERANHHLLSLYDGRPGIARFTVIELMDAGSIAHGEPRIGLAELAQQFLMSEGSLVTSQRHLYGPTLEDDAPTYTSSALRAVVPGRMAPDSDVLQQHGNVSEEQRVPGTADSGAAGIQSEVRRAFAWTVWEDHEQKGFMDLYNLPQIDEDKAAHMWLRGAGSEHFVHVDLLPPLDEGSGSVFYSIDIENFTPEEIIISVESQADPATPSGDIILRGP